MSGLEIFFIAGLCIFCITPVAVAKCPATMPIKIGRFCYRMQTDILRFNDARDNCMKLEPGGMITSYKTKLVLEKLEKLLYDFVLSKLEKAVWWIGIKMDDTSLSKAAEKRTWSTDYYDSKWVQKDYKMWETEGGPKDKGLTCAVINGSNDFMVKPVDCGGPRVPVICMMKEGEKCKHSALPYLQYGPHCLAALNGAAEYNKIHGACSPNTPTPFEDDEMKKWVMMAAKNSFFGGGLYMNMMKNGDKFYDMSDGTVPSDDMWEEGEPRGEYSCVGLSFQSDNSLKLKTMNCEFFAGSLCFVNRTYLEGIR